MLDYFFISVPDTCKKNCGGGNVYFTFWLWAFQADSKALDYHGREDMVEQGCSVHGDQGAEKGKEWSPSVSFQDTPL